MCACACVSRRARVCVCVRVCVCARACVCAGCVCACVRLCDVCLCVPVCALCVFVQILLKNISKIPKKNFKTSMTMMHKTVKVQWYTQGAIKALHLVILQTSIRKSLGIYWAPNEKSWRISREKNKTQNYLKDPQKNFKTSMAMMHEIVKVPWYPQGAIKALHLEMLQTCIRKSLAIYLALAEKFWHISKKNITQKHLKDPQKTL